MFSIFNIFCSRHLLLDILDTPQVSSVAVHHPTPLDKDAQRRCAQRNWLALHWCADWWLAAMFDAGYKPTIWDLWIESRCSQYVAIQVLADSQISLGDTNPEEWWLLLLVEPLLCKPSWVKSTWQVDLQCPCEYYSKEKFFPKWDSKTGSSGNHTPWG